MSDPVLPTYKDLAGRARLVIERQIRQLQAQVVTSALNPADMAVLVNLAKFLQDAEILELASYKPPSPDEVRKERNRLRMAAQRKARKEKNAKPDSKAGPQEA